MKQWDQLADKESINKTIEFLLSNGINAKFVQTASEAKLEVLSLIPDQAEVMTMTSVTLDSVGLSRELNESQKYISVRNQLNKMDRASQNSQMQKMGAAPDWTVGSVHAVTEDGHVLIASNTGSQLPAYASGASNVIWVVGVQKITKNTDEAMKRIYEYVLPLESKRANKAYNITTGSNVSKLLIINKEIKPGRITIIFVGEKLGF